MPPRSSALCSVVTLPMTARVTRKDVPVLFPHHPAAKDCGFTIVGRLPAGLHVAGIEVQGSDDTWHCFKQFTIAVENAPFHAVIDRPIAAGRLTDRVRVGGWAICPEKSVQAITLRYGHREIACDINLPRADVAALHSAHPQADKPGFETSDYLVAGHGLVRIKARFSDGTSAIVRSPIEFSIATDENHGPELDLTVPRIDLETCARRRVAGPTPLTARPLNVLFILPGSFSANSALHVAALADELAAAGHACAVAVSHDLATLAHHEHPAFRGLLHAEAEAGVAFPDGRGPDVLHAWTTRENVRVLAEKLRARHGCRVIVHLEDNEQQLLAHALHCDLAALGKMSDTELDRLVPGDLSHPHRSRAFLAAADGVTVIADRLREFVPAGRPCQTLWPAADARYFFPRPRPDDFRRMLDLAPNETVLFYHGNVHAANAAEVRELYAAVLLLNRTGHSVTLVRTGLDRLDFLGPLAAEVTPHVLALGQILHHRHLPSLMALADIFVQPGEPDPFNDYRFPSKLPEFFALGRPVILPRTNLGTQLRPGIDAYVLDKADAASIAAAVIALRADPALCARLSAGAVEFAAAHFSWRRTAETLAKFYASVAAS